MAQHHKLFNHLCPTADVIDLDQKCPELLVPHKYRDLLSLAAASYLMGVQRAAIVIAPLAIRARRSLTAQILNCFFFFEPNVRFDVVGRARSQN